MKHRNILSVSADAKTVKGQKLGFLTGILYLSPAKLSGHQVCPMARVAACEKPCLNSAGRGAFNSVQIARSNKTTRFFEDREAFMADLVFSIRSLIRKAEKLGLTPLVRLNGTSDITWEKIPVGGAPNIMALFPDLTFYDYTKRPNRTVPANYDLTFSYSGAPSFAKYNELAIARGMRIAAVWRDKASIPASFKGLDVLPGDDSDVRHIEPQGAFVALYAKGKAKSDQSGFVLN